MKNQIRALKVKIKSLAEEARIIRLEERRAKGRRKRDKDGKVIPGEFVYRDDTLYKSMRDHRMIDVRVEQRHSLLAYAYLRGKRYDSAERSKKDISYSRFRDLVEKFGGLPGLKTKCDLTDLHLWVTAKPVEVVNS